MDQEALKFVLSALVERAGSGEKAAGLLGLSQGSYSKLMNGQRKALAYATYLRLAHLLGGQASEHGRAPRPVLAFIPDPTPHDVERHNWARGFRDVEAAEQNLRRLREAEAKNASDLFDALQRCVLTDDQNFVWAHYEYWIEQELERLTPLAASILDTLWKDSDCGPLLKGFLEEVGRDRDQLPSDHDLRCWLALYRAVAPLADAETTWGVERSIKEMRQLRELKHYLEIALKREEILLRPRRDSERVRRGRPPMSFDEWAAEVAAEEWP